MSIYFAMAVFSLVMSISPGPVNMITLAIGANSGYRKALPFVAGATIGFTILLLSIGIGLGELITSAPYFMQVISVIGTGFICYIGVMIAISDDSSTATTADVPGFTQGFLLQWLNPKAWAACLAGVAIFASSESRLVLYTFVTIYFVICFFGIACWAVFGEKALAVVKSPSRLRVFNRIMGITLVIVALFMLYEHLSGFN